MQLNIYANVTGNDTRDPPGFFQALIPRVLGEFRFIRDRINLVLRYWPQDMMGLNIRSRLWVIGRYSFDQLSSSFQIKPTPLLSANSRALSSNMKSMVTSVGNICMAAVCPDKAALVLTILIKVAAAALSFNRCFASAATR